MGHVYDSELSVFAISPKLSNEGSYSVWGLWTVCEEINFIIYIFSSLSPLHFDEHQFYSLVTLPCGCQDRYIQGGLLMEPGTNQNRIRNSDNRLFKLISPPKGETL
uniref:Uncharacterized protein n=1 Tax=Cacopsylla melanoneura TaxID=428564 RepID=A0A8D9BRV6_9HEMI